MAQHAMVVRTSARALRNLGCGSPIRIVTRHQPATRSHSLPPRLPQHSSANTRSASSHSKEPRNILGYSSIILQDGINFNELPLVIRRLEAGMLPFRSIQDKIMQTTQRDVIFGEQLQNCHTVEQVMKLLHIPGEHVSAYSSAFTLERLATLRNSSEDYVESFVQKAILNELCDTAARGIAPLTNDTVINLTKNLLKMNNLDPGHMEKVNKELDSRIGDHLFSISELCHLIQVLSEHVRADEDVTNSAWIHLGNRFEEIDHSNIVWVCQNMRYASSKQDFLWPLLNEQISKNIEKLQASEVARIAVCLSMAKRPAFNSTLSRLANWTWVNIQQVNDIQLQDILTAFRKVDHMENSWNFLNSALDRYVVLKKDKISKALIASVMDHFLHFRTLSTKVFHTVALDLEVNSHLYTAQELFLALRPFGKLNYQPPNAQRLFESVEKTLLERIGEFPAPQLLELLTSFGYIERFPLNFLNHLYNRKFLGKLMELPEGPARDKAAFYYMEFQAIIILECSRIYAPPFLDLKHLGFEDYYWKVQQHPQQRNFHNLLTESVGRILGFTQEEMWHNLHLEMSPYRTELRLQVDKKGRVLEMGKCLDDKSMETRNVAIVVMMDFHRCYNTGHLLGQQATMIRHLKKQGFFVVQVSSRTFALPVADLDAHIKKLLSKHVNFKKMGL